VGRFDQWDVAGNNAKPGFVWRRQFIKESKEVDMTGCIHADLFFQDRYLLNEVNVKIRFISSRDSFSLIEEHENRIVIESTILYV